MEAPRRRHGNRSTASSPAHADRHPARRTVPVLALLLVVALSLGPVAAQSPDRPSAQPSGPPPGLTAIPDGLGPSLPGPVVPASHEPPEPCQDVMVLSGSCLFECRLGSTVHIMAVGPNVRAEAVCGGAYVQCQDGALCEAASTWTSRGDGIGWCHAEGTIAFYRCWVD